MRPDPRPRNRPALPAACAAVQSRLYEYLDGALPAAARQEMETHLSACAACRRESEISRHAETALASAIREQPSPGDLRPDFYARLAQERAANRRAHRQWGFGLSALAACGLALAFLRPAPPASAPGDASQPSDAAVPPRPPAAQIAQAGRAQKPEQAPPPNRLRAEIADNKAATQGVEPSFEKTRQASRPPEPERRAYRRRRSAKPAPAPSDDRAPALMAKANKTLPEAETHSFADKPEIMASARDNTLYKLSQQTDKFSIAGAETERLLRFKEKEDGAAGAFRFVPPEKKLAETAPGAPMQRFAKLRGITGGRQEEARLMSVAARPRPDEVAVEVVDEERGFIASNRVAGFVEEREGETTVYVNAESKTVEKSR